MVIRGRQQSTGVRSLFGNNGFLFSFRIRETTNDNKQPPDWQGLESHHEGGRPCLLPVGHKLLPNPFPYSIRSFPHVLIAPLPSSTIQRHHPSPARPVTRIFRQCFLLNVTWRPAPPQLPCTATKCQVWRVLMSHPTPAARNNLRHTPPGSAITYTAKNGASSGSGYLSIPCLAVKVDIQIDQYSP